MNKQEKIIKQLRKKLRQEYEEPVEIWRDFIAISLLLMYSLIIGLLTFIIFDEGLGYFTIIPLTFFLFIFGYIFHHYLKARGEFYS